MKNYIKYLVLAFSFLFVSSLFAGVVPYPNSYVEKSGTFRLPTKVKVGGDSSFLKIVKTASDVFKNAGANLELEWVAKNPEVIIEKSGNLTSEAYEISVSEKSVRVYALDDAGVLYALVTLCQLAESNSGKINACHIKDAPALQWRGFMIDIARNFLGKEFIFKTIDQLAMLKFNVLHLHLTDHQGWRIEIKKYPKLTEVGAFWCPYVKNGFLTQDEVKEIIAYAATRNIKVLPEIEILSHATAAVKAYPFLGHGFGVSVGDPKVREFFRDVIDEIIALFPSREIHLAGDEVDYKIWGKNPTVQEYIKQNNLESLLDAHVCYMDEMGRYLEKKGRVMMAWDESFGKGAEEVKKGMKAGKATISKNAIMHFWTGKIEGMADAAKKGHPIVNANCYYTYFNYYHNKAEKSYLPPDGDKIVDGPSKGYDNYLYSSPISLKKAYDFCPVAPELDDATKKNIIGTSCQLWFKPIDTVERFYDRAFPRAAAHAEVAWSSSKDYQRFLKNLSVLERFWDRAQITYNKEAISEK